MKRKLRLSPVARLSSLLRGGNLVAFNVGPDRTVYFVIALRPLDYQFEQPGWATFPKTVPAQPQTYRVLALSAGQLFLDVVIEEERFNIHDIQPLGDELLLVCVRSNYKTPNDFEKNGRVYTRSGRFAREILLGDGIQSVQTTAKGLSGPVSSMKGSLATMAGRTLSVARAWLPGTPRAISCTSSNRVKVWTLFVTATL
jgi:hypothetical protein